MSDQSDSTTAGPERMPFGEALLVAREQKVAILWTCGQVSVAAPATPVERKRFTEPGSAAKAVQPTDNRAKLQKPAPKGDPNLRLAACCAKFNAGSCARRQKMCPIRKKHACSNKLASR